MKITSPAFGQNEKIPEKFTCDGQNASPELGIDEIPNGTKTLVLLVEDPDAPSTFNHWVVFNISPARTIAENTVPGIEGVNSAKRHSYVGPCPPSGTHRYIFKVYALDTELNLSSNATKQDVEKAMKGHVLAQGQLVGLYSRK